MNEKKLQKIIKLINDNNLDGIVFCSDYNRYWFTNFLSSAGYLFINKKGDVTLLIDGRYYQKACNEIFGIEIEWLGNPNLKLSLVDHITKICEKMYIKSIGLEKDYSTLETYELFKSIFDNNIKFLKTASLRDVKFEDEIKNLKKACEISAQTANWIQQNIKPGMSEKEVANMITIHQLELGATKNSFDPIVAAGVNGGYPHHKPTDYIIQDGDMVTIDLGCIYNNYCSDITRSFFISSPDWDSEIGKIYNIVKKAQAAGLALCDGKHSGKEVDDACRKIINDSGYGIYFNHGTGHGVGIEIHELPNTNAGNLEILPINSVVTVEPGIYVPGLGGVRIEDTVLVKENGCEILTDQAIK